MAQISVEIIRLTGSLLRGNLQLGSSSHTSDASHGISQGIEKVQLVLKQTLSSTLYIFVSGPNPKDALVCDKFQRLTEGEYDPVHVIDVFPSASV
jgi:hypothetical protein